MLNENFFAPEVEFRPLLEPAGRREKTVKQSFVLNLGRWSCATVAVFTLQPFCATEPRIVPSAIYSSHPAPELTPEIVALYRDAATEDRELAESGISDFRAVVDSADKADDEA